MMNITLKNIITSLVVVLGSFVSGSVFAQEQSPYVQISWGNDSIDSPSGDDGTAYPNGSITGVGSEDRTGSDAPEER